MNELQSAVGDTVRTCLLGELVAEKTDSSVDHNQRYIQRHGHKGILTFDPESKMESITTTKEAFSAPKKLGVRTRGIRRELLEKHMARIICEQRKTETNPPTPKTDYSTTSRTAFSAPGPQLAAAEPTSLYGRDYRTNEAITFWSENCQQVQGMTSNTSFRKCSRFSRPIRERLDDEDD